ncbi:glycoside hydrolase family 140 protein [Mucilaginibacter myungsuensis]|uniref:Glycoside hydrolase family 140 protein n=1 Tax=Mucilaginibacter myungsuensis TaxID=649104 RepID=A0A929KVC7_9SPHI|nr:glycoside hydrolase family 140 protein [Mucilaginibacter myungsuensis]MBE9661427.1 glycoside hydrolase family 140 protein [Mucilaginibacter myungsuensis]MDN3597570.1 glycoside hydrolase family 140 protein [Mucilaginibacter myungsuensis]
MKKLLLCAILLILHFNSSAQFIVSADKHHVLKDGKPFFWLGDTAWELFHRLDRNDADRYLKRRAEEGFTMIQAVVLAEFDGLNQANPYGEKPLDNNDPTKPNPKYFEHVDYVIDKAASLGLNIALLPTWGDKLNKEWGIGPEIFNEQNAATYATWLVKRYKSKKNLVWVLGGDRNPKNAKEVAVWNAMGKAIKQADPKAFVTYHCQPNQLGSAQWFNNESWFDFNMFQNGHCRDSPIYDKILASYNSQPTRPVLDGEPLYEDHPICFNAKDLGTSSPYDVRKYAYLDLFSGAFGHTYGCHDVWQMYSPKHDPINGPHNYWYDALDLPGANQMTYLKKLMTSHPILDRVPDQSIIEENNNSAAERIQATRGKDFIFIYSAWGKPFTVLPGKISGEQLNAYWFNPRDGKVRNIGTQPNVKKKYTPPDNGYGHDWVLVLDAQGTSYKIE